MLKRFQVVRVYNARARRLTDVRLGAESADGKYFAVYACAAQDLTFVPDFIARATLEAAVNSSPSY